MTAATPSDALLHRVFRVLTDLPSPEQVLAIEPTPEESARIDYLVEKKRLNALTPEEKAEVDQYVMIEGYVRLAKAKAMVKLKENRAA